MNPDADIPVDPMLFDIGEPIDTVDGSLMVEEQDEQPEPRDTTVPLPFAPLTGAAFDKERTYRYALWRRFLEKGDTCLFIMLNPSTADEMKNDPTITRCEGFARGFGYARLVVANLFALRATDPRHLKLHENAIGYENDAWIKKLRAMSKLCICAWGCHGKLYGRDQAVMAYLREMGPLHCLKKTKHGHPNHPLYLRADLKPMEF